MKKLMLSKSSSEFNYRITIKMRKKLTIALVAHDHRKADMVDWVIFNSDFLSHHHLVCTECGKTECIDICPMNEQYEQEAARKGFTITGHVFEFYGLCHDCQQKKHSGN